MKWKKHHILAMIIGLVVLFLPDMKFFPFVLGLIYFFCGGIFGFFWPKESWRWGIWIVGPVTVLIGLSVLFAGQLDVFLKKDIPMILLAITSCCMGSFLSAWFKNRGIRETTL